MAQRTEKEETEFKIVAEPITPCITTSTSPTIISSTSNSSSLVTLQHKSARSTSPRSSPVVKIPEFVKEKETSPVILKKEVSRCSGCRRKVGLTGFRCRCGDLFCSHHRYSDRHDCTYDYKSAARETIARENPVVKAAKIVRI